MKRKIVVGITGASGAPYARRLLEVLRASGTTSSSACALSQTAPEVWALECGGDLREAVGVPGLGRARLQGALRERQRRLARDGRRAVLDGDRGAHRARHLRHAAHARGRRDAQGAAHARRRAARDAARPRAPREPHAARAPRRRSSCPRCRRSTASPRRSTTRSTPSSGASSTTSGSSTSSLPPLGVDDERARRPAHRARGPGRRPRGAPRRGASTPCDGRAPPRRPTCSRWGRSPTASAPKRSATRCASTRDAAPDAGAATSWCCRAAGDDADGARAAARGRHRSDRPDREGARVRVDWTRCGLELAQVALGFGANELAGRIANKRGPAARGGREARRRQEVAPGGGARSVKRRELEGFVRRAGRTPVVRAVAGGHVMLDAIREKVERGRAPLLRGRARALPPPRRRRRRAARQRGARAPARRPHVLQPQHAHRGDQRLRRLVPVLLLRQARGGRARARTR